MPRQIQPLLLMLVDLALRRAHQVERLPLRLAHLLQNGFARNAAIHHPHPPRFAVGLFDLAQKSAQRRPIRRVAVHHFIGQRKSIRRHHQRDHQLQTVRSPIPAVAAPGFRILLHLPFEVRAGQIVEQHFEVGTEQIGPLLLQPNEQLLLVLQHPIQTAIQPVLLGHREVRLQQLVHRAVDEPLPMHAKLAARIEQTIDHQQPQHLLPTHRFAPFRQPLLPELIQPQLLPQLACQPAVAEYPRPPQFQPAQLHLHAVDRIGGKFPVVRKQTQRPIALFFLIEHLQRLAPRCLLLIVDLAQIQHCPLHRLAARHTAILHDAEVAMVLAVLLPVCAAQKHRSSRMPEKHGLGKRVGLHPAGFRVRGAEGKTLTTRWTPNQPLSAKVRLTASSGSRGGPHTSGPASCIAP